MRNWIHWPPSWATLLLLPALFVGFTVHELAHALVAYLLGDTSQVERKRLSFNPLRHVSWLGMVAFLLFGIGWARPVWVDYRRFRLRNRAWGMFLVSISGAAANLLTALAVLAGVTGMVMVVSLLGGAQFDAILVFLLSPQPRPDVQGMVVALTYDMITVNLLLALFNLLPLPPLDGFQALISLFNGLYSALRGERQDRPAWRPAPAGDGGAASTLSPAQIHFTIALEYQKQGKLDEAIVRYRQAIAQDERFALAWYNLGLAYWARGRLPLAGSSFKMAAQMADDAALRGQAEMRLRELAEMEQQSGAGPGPLPPPLEPGEVPQEVGEGAQPLDPAVERRLWLRLSVGAAFFLLLAVAAWLFVTVATLLSVG